jgi:formylglycine-generating enzyme required for sulfatase activity
LEERETAVECRQVGGVWRCDRNLRAALSAGEVGRRSATATAVAIPTATAQAISQATAQAQATAAAPASGSLAIPQGIGDWITAWTLTEQEGDDLFCFGPCPKLCGSGCDNLEITVFNSLDTTDADRANGIAAKWCAEVELIAKNDDGLWTDKRLYYEIAQTGGQITLLDDTFWNPALGQTPTCRATARIIDPAQATATAQALAAVVARTSEEILIPASSFQMGCDRSNSAESCLDDEQPLHAVTLDAYFIDKYEVTNARYQACVDAGGCEPPQGASSYSTRCVLWKSRASRTTR